MNDLEDLVKRLANVAHFKDLPENALKDIVFAGQILYFPEGSIIFREGEPASGLYVLFKGLAHLRKSGIKGQESIISIIRPVIMFNEVTVIDNKPNPVTAVAVQDCVTWRISYEHYRVLMQRYPEMGTGLLNAMAARNRNMLNLYEDLISRPILARIAKTLLDLSNNGKQPINRYKNSNQQIAAFTATVPEAVSRSIKNLKIRGVIQCNRAEIRIINLEEVMELALIEPILLEYKLPQ